MSCRRKGILVTYSRELFIYIFDVQLCINIVGVNIDLSTVLGSVQFTFMQKGTSLLRIHRRTGNDYIKMEFRRIGNRDWIWLQLDHDRVYWEACRIAIVDLSASGTAMLQLVTVSQ